MTEIQILGVNGEPAGTMTGQLALAHTYGSGEEDSCENTVLAVENLLYGVEVDHYVSMTMDGWPSSTTWWGGVTLEVLDDFSGIDGTLVQGETVTLKGQQALTYVRSRDGPGGTVPTSTAWSGSGSTSLPCRGSFPAKPSRMRALPWKPCSSSTSTWSPTARWSSSPPWGTIWHNTT